MLQAMRNDASGYVFDSENLLQTIEDVSTGDIYLSAPLSKQAIEAYVSKA